MKKFFTILAVMTVIMIAPVAQAQSTIFEPVGWHDKEVSPITVGTYFWAQVVNCNEWISLREYPSTAAPRIAKVPLGATVKIYRGMLGERSSSPTNGFYQTYYDGMCGWCLMEYINVGEIAGSRS